VRVNIFVAALALVLSMPGIAVADGFFDGIGEVTRSMEGVRELLRETSETADAVKEAGGRVTPGDSAAVSEDNPYGVTTQNCPQLLEALQDIRAGKQEYVQGIALLGVSEANAKKMHKAIDLEKSQEYEAYCGADSPVAPAELRRQAVSAPPPLPVAEWHVELAGKATGPHDTDNVLDLISSGEITRQTRVWQKGMEGWQPAGEVSQLSSKFGAVPPPLPSQ